MSEIHEAIPAIMAEIGIISKDRTNESQRYKFRGIDDVYNAVHPLLIKYKVFTVPEILEVKDEQVTTSKGNVLFYSRMLIKYTMFAKDGSFITGTVRGEGMDSGDKASNKAMAVAHKYFFIQIFAIPTGEAVDPENDSHEVRAPDRKELAREMKGPAAPNTPNEKNTKNPIDEKMEDLRKRFAIVKNSGLFSQAQMKEMNAEVEKNKENRPSIEHLVGKYELDMLERQANQKKHLDAIFETTDGKSDDIF